MTGSLFAEEGRQGVRPRRRFGHRANTARRYSVIAARAQPGICRRTAPRAVEGSTVVSIPSNYRELDQRTADGLAVSLEWNAATDALRVVVVDRESATVTFPVRAEDASDAFIHPFVYAGRTGCEVA
jgi:hypothetical protein